MDRVIVKRMLSGWMDICGGFLRNSGSRVEIEGYVYSMHQYGISEMETCMNQLCRGDATACGEP